MIPAGSGSVAGSREKLYILCKGSEDDADIRASQTAWKNLNADEVQKQQ